MKKYILLIIGLVLILGYFLMNFLNQNNTTANNENNTEMIEDFRISGQVESMDSSQLVIRTNDNNQSMTFTMSDQVNFKMHNPNTGDFEDGSSDDVVSGVMVEVGSTIENIAVQIYVYPSSLNSRLMGQIVNFSENILTLHDDIQGDFDIELTDETNILTIDSENYYANTDRELLAVGRFVRINMTSFGQDGQVQSVIVYPEEFFGTEEELNE